jgi:hypothetical protein
MQEGVNVRIVFRILLREFSRLTLQQHTTLIQTDFFRGTLHLTCTVVHVLEEASHWLSCIAQARELCLSDAAQ